MHSTFVTRLRGSRLINSGIWYLSSNVGQKAVALLAVAVFTRLLNTAEYGTFAVFQSWLAIFAATITLGVSSAVGRAKYDYPDDQFQGFLSAVSVLGLLSSACAIASIAFLPTYLLESVFAFPKALVVLSALAAAAELPIYVAMASWQIAYRYRRHAIFGMALAIAKVAIPIALALMPEQTVDAGTLRIIGTASASVLFGVSTFVFLAVSGHTLINRSYWRYAVSYSIPLIPHMLSGFVLAHFDRILISRYVGVDEAGLYTVAYQIGEVGLILWSASNAAWVPWFYEQMGKHNTQLIRRRATQYLLIYAAMTIGFITLAPALVTLLAPPAYHVARSIVPLIMCSQFFTLLYSFYVNVEFYEKKTGFVSVGTALAAAVNVLLNVWLLPIYGYHVAAWTTLVAYILLFLFHAAIVRFRLQTPPMFRFSLMVVIATGMVVVCAIFYAVLSNS